MSVGQIQPSHPQRGMIMLIVLVLLVLMSIVGAAYVQVARYDRSCAKVRFQSHIQTVAKATVAYIGEVLKNDLLETNANGDTTMFDGINDEPYDYPWTNLSSFFHVRDIHGTPFPYPAHGGRLDDTWLASSEPDFSNAVPTWPHITNLNGIFLRIPSPINNRPDVQEAVVRFTLNPYQWWTDSNIPMTNGITAIDFSGGGYLTTGADADGDGILDSKWTWAPIRQMSGVRYVMAVRIIDNSAMINFNTASGLTYDTDQYEIPSTSMASDIIKGNNSPRWIFPSELDMSNFLYQMGLTGIAINSTLKTLGQTDLSQTRVPWFISNNKTRRTRYDYWHNAASLWGNTISPDYVPFATTTNEIELRHRNGLNNDQKTTAMEASALSTFLRMSNAESSYTDTGFISIQSYFQSEPRHQITTINGAANYLPVLPEQNINGDVLNTKEDINRLFDTLPNTTSGYYMSDASLQKVSDTVLQTIEIGKNNALTRFEYSSNAKINSNQQYADQFAVSMADHFDRDNWTTEFNGRYGAEAWPAISEVYIQRPAAVFNGQLVAGGTDYYLSRSRVGPTGTIGYIIEIVNPHTRPISIKDIYLDISYKLKNVSDPVTVTLGQGASLWDLASNQVKDANSGDTWLMPGQRLLIYKNSTGYSLDPNLGRLAGIDKVIDRVVEINKYPTWQAGTQYTVGQEIQYDVDGDTITEVMVCIRDHTAVASNAPKTIKSGSEFSFHPSQDYWQRKIILVDGGAWNVPDIGLDDTVPTNVTLSLRPRVMKNGVVTDATWPYQSIDIYCWNQYPISPTKLRIAENIGLWAEGQSYQQGDFVFALHPNPSLGFQVFYCTQSHSNSSLLDAPSAPSTPYWIRRPLDNYMYLQSSAIGSADGLNALAVDSYTHNEKRQLMQTYYGSVFNSEFDRLGLDKKRVLKTWSASGTYTQGDLVKKSGQIQVCTQSYNGTTRTGNAQKAAWSIVGSSSPTVPMDSTTNQLLNDDMLEAYVPWRMGLYYLRGDVVREKNAMSPNSDGDRLFVSTRSGFSTFNSVPGAAGSQYNWTEHWRTANAYVVDNVAKLAHVMVAGPGPTTELPDILSKVSNVDQLMLNLNGKNMSTNRRTWFMPHAIALINQYSIHDPSQDGVDNDGIAGIDNPEELLVPGLVNLNTIPAHLLQKILPLVDPVKRQAIVNKIVADRVTLNGFINPYHIYQSLSSLLIDGADNSRIKDVVVDFQRPGLRAVGDGIADDREEAVLPTQWLTGVASTRSDIYTAYILIRGYPAGDFRRGIVESKRLIVVYDRSNIVNARSTPRILAMYTFD